MLQRYFWLLLCLKKVRISLRDLEGEYPFCLSFAVIVSCCYSFFCLLEFFESFLFCFHENKGWGEYLCLCHSGGVSCKVFLSGFLVHNIYKLLNSRE